MKQVLDITVKQYEAYCLVLRKLFDEKFAIIQV